MTTATSKGHTVTRYAVDENHRLSLAHWQDGDITRASVALMRKNLAGKWVFAETWETWGRDPKVVRYFLTDKGAEVVAEVLGQYPERFFRDNVL